MTDQIDTGDNPQVRANPLTGEWTCHRAYCHTQIGAPGGAT